MGGLRYLVNARIFRQSQISKALIVMDGPFFCNGLFRFGQHLGYVFTDHIGWLIGINPPPVHATGVKKILIIERISRGNAPR